MNNSKISKAGFQASHITAISPLEDHSVIAQLNAILNLMKMCYRPFGQMCMLQNNHRGHLTLTSSISRIARQLDTKDPIIKFILTSVEGHINTFSDGGLIAGFLCLHLILTSLGLNINRAVLSDIYSILLEHCTVYLGSASCHCKRYIDLSNTQDLYAVVNGIMSSCTACHLDRNELDHVNKLILKAFLNSIPNNGDLSKMCSIQYVGIEGMSPSHSHVIEGLIYQVPFMTLKRSMLTTVNTLALTSEPIKVILFNISLSGDSESFMNMKHEMAVGAYSDMRSLDRSDMFDEQVLIKLMKESKINVLACQKVVHPSMYRACLEHAILVIDRLGEQLAKVLQHISGAQPIGMANIGHLDDNIGMLHTVEPIELGRKTYLRLHNSNTVTNTLVLCHRYGEPLQELRHCVETASHVLLQTLQTPYVLAGGGRWLLDVADHVIRVVQQKHTDILEETNCTKSVLKIACGNFVKCLRYVAMSANDQSDNVSLAELDAESLSFNLGQKNEVNVGKKIEKLAETLQQQQESQESVKPFTLVKENKESPNLVLDSFVTQSKAMQCAVKTAAILLKVNVVITDPN